MLPCKDVKDAIVYMTVQYYQQTNIMKTYITIIIIMSQT